MMRDAQVNHLGRDHGQITQHREFEAQIKRGQRENRQIDALTLPEQSADRSDIIFKLLLASTEQSAS